MDNLTHSLMGMVAGEAVARLTPPGKDGLPTDARRGILITLTTVGGNLPDIDLVLTYRGFVRDKLGYLLEHRGYTHTVLGCLVLATLIYAMAECWARFRRLPMNRSDHLTLFAVAVCGTLLHLGMDALNSYGVHPLWPFYNGWIYGDSIFIVEPLYWLAAAPLFFVAKSIAARAVVATAVLAGIAGSILMSPGWIWLVFLALLTVGLLVLGNRHAAATATLASVIATICVTALLVIAGRVAARDINSVASRDFPGDRIIDHVLSPIPTNPFCWDVLLLATRGDHYIARHGMLSVAPDFVTAQGCSTKLVSKDATAPMAEVRAPESADTLWFGEFSMPVSRLANLTANNCRAAALMQFVRAPFVVERRSGWVIGDLRFDRERGLGLAEIEISSTQTSDCPPRAPWIPPREALLGVK
ncbi:MAG: metal-dependent hydrolase [Proteobacteria bacterium]|nr:metal-dependent hydrolase [Pseudomonadota bacterium]